MHFRDPEMLYENMALNGSAPWHKEGQRVRAQEDGQEGMPTTKHKHGENGGRERPPSVIGAPMRTQDTQAPFSYTNQTPTHAASPHLVMFSDVMGAGGLEAAPLVDVPAAASPSSILPVTAADAASAPLAALVLLSGMLAI